MSGIQLLRVAAEDAVRSGNPRVGQAMPADDCWIRYTDVPRRVSINPAAGTSHSRIDAAQDLRIRYVQRCGSNQPRPPDASDPAS